jgi:iron complex transport system substrate-binding protein
MKYKPVLIALIIFFLLASFAEAGERLLTDELGRKVTIPPAVKRIVSLAPSITETLFALGLNEEIAGVTDFCDYPAAVSEKIRVGGFINPSIEKIVSLKPDLIIAIRDGNREETILRLTELGFPVYVVNPKSYDRVVKTIQNIGEIVGRQEESKKIAKKMIATRENISSLTQSLPKPKIFFQFGDALIVTAGKGTLADDLIRLAGGMSVSEDESASYPLYSIESVLTKAPEIIIISSMENKKNYANIVKKWGRWKSLPAVKKNAIHVVDSNCVDRPAPRITLGLIELAKIIHPEILKKMEQKEFDTN